MSPGMSLSRARRAAVAAPLMVLLVACGAGSDGAPAAATQNGPAAASTYQVTGYTFGSLTVASGTTLRLADGDAEPHTVTADDGSFDSGAFDNTAAGSLTAPMAPGSYPFHCTIHPSMHGTLVVR